VTAPDFASAWYVAHEIANGEYVFPGLTPRKGDRVVDVGANVGLYSLWAARKGATVTAYEPGPDAFTHLDRNVLGKSITAIHAAVVGAEPDGGTIRLYLDGERSTRNTITARNIGNGAELANFVVTPALSLATVLRGGCDLLKIDCEGAEFDIIANTAPDVLATARRVVLEFHSQFGSGDTLLAQLRAAGFSAQIISRDEEFGVIGAAQP
jgi:FkbM family methyltransferase